MKHRNQITTCIEIGKAEISMLDKEERKRFHLGLLGVMKRMGKDPQIIAEFHEWQEARKLKDWVQGSPLQQKATQGGPPICLDKQGFTRKV